MEKKFIPPACIGEGCLFEGHVILKVPSTDERLEYLDKCGFGLEGTASKRDQLKMQAELLKVSYPHYISVDIKRKEDGYQFKSLDELKYDSSCSVILTEVASALLNGFTLGKN